METLFIFIWIYIVMISISLWEAYAEGRNAWTKGKKCWRISVGKFEILSGYHFHLFWITLPMLLLLPLLMYGWDNRVFGVLASAYFSGILVEDLFWYVVNPSVKFKEFYTNFSDYYPWVKINGKKIVPLFYIVCILIAIASWYFLWG